MIQSGDADAVVTGGSEAALTPLSTRRLRARSTRCRTSGISRPFDARRDGFVMGEGAGVLVLEDAETARGARRRRSSATVRGYGATSDAYHLTAPRAGRRAARRRRCSAALDDAGLHAGGRRLRQRPRHLDAAQRPRRDAGASRRRSASTRTRSRCRRPKSAIGHLLGAAGAVEAVATLLALRDRDRPADARLRGARRGAGPRLRARRGPAAGRQRQARRRDLELVRLRRPQRRALPGGRMTDRRCVAAALDDDADARSSGWRRSATRGSLHAAALRRRARAGWASARARATA